MVDSLVWYSIRIPPFAVFVHTPDLTLPDTTGYTLYSTAGAWLHKVKFTLPGHLFTYLGSQSVCVALSVTFIRGFVMIMD